MCESSRNELRHIFDGDTFYFYLFIFRCDVFPCLSLSWHGMVIHFAQELLAPSWCCAVFCLTSLVHILCGFCTGGICCFSCGMWIFFNLYQFFFRIWFCLIDIRFVDNWPIYRLYAVFLQYIYSKLKIIKILLSELNLKRIFDLFAFCYHVNKRTYFNMQLVHLLNIKRH